MQTYQWQYTRQDRSRKIRQCGTWFMAVHAIDDGRNTASTERFGDSATTGETYPVVLYNCTSGSLQRWKKSFSPFELRLSQQAFLWVEMLGFEPIGKTLLDRDALDIVFRAENGGEPVFDSPSIWRDGCAPLWSHSSKYQRNLDLQFYSSTIQPRSSCTSAAAEGQIPVR